MNQKREGRTWGDRGLAGVPVYLASALSSLGPKIAASGKAMATNPFASEYQAWRDQFLRNRLRIALWVGMSFVFTMVIFFLWAAIDDFAQQKPFKASFFWSSAAVATCLLTCYRLYKTPLGRRYPEAIFLGFSWSLTVVTQTSVALSGLRILMKPLWMIVFLNHATLMPVRWRLHVASQLSAYICYLLVNAALNLSTAVRLLDHVATILPLFWVCLVCDLSVYLYERLQQTEFSTRRELEIAYQRVEAAEAKYRSIFENALEGIFQSSPQGNYLTVNPTLAKIYGFDSSEELIESLSDIQHQLFVDPNRYTELMQLLEQNGVVSDFGAQVYRKDATVIWICIQAREVRDEQGILLYHEGLIEDITERKRAEEALRVFFHAVSHDLRNPVTGTLMVLKNLEQQSGDMITLPRRILERMIQSGDRQLNLINTLLEAQVNEVKGMVVHCQPLQLYAMVQEVAAELEPMLAQNKVTLINSIPVDLPEVNADATQIWRVFENLISNALNHNPPGLTLKLFAEVNESMVCCSIQDDGVGMTQEECDNLFNLYRRGSSIKRSLGFGLGLYICRQIINAHGGKIGAVSNPGAGARFWFTLPITSSPVCMNQLEEVKSSGVK
ncbi:MAG: PAS domain-containing sensor histidine kinase [Cyanobacteriota bacterium]